MDVKVFNSKSSRQHIHESLYFSLPRTQPTTMSNNNVLSLVAGFKHQLAIHTSFLLRLKGFTLSFFDHPGPVPRFTELGGWDKGRPLASLAAGHGSEVLQEGWLLQLTDLVTIRIFLRLIVVVVLLIISECDVDRNAVCAVSVMVGN